MSDILLPPGAGDIALPPSAQQAQADPTAIDLTKDIDDQTFRKGLLSILHNIAEQIGVQNRVLDEHNKMVYDATAMRLQTLEKFGLLVDNFEAIGLIDRPADADTSEETDAPADTAGMTVAEAARAEAGTPLDKG